MDTTTYLTWLPPALLAVGVLSWALARHQSRTDLRAEQAQRLLRALERYSQWISAQRLAAVFSGESPDAAAALDSACTIRLAWFPELAGEMAELLGVHNRLINFLGTQQQLWLRDPEHWLESDHDQRFMALWRQHRFALQALLARLEQVARLRIAPAPTPPQSDTTYA